MVYHRVLNTVPCAICSFRVPQWTWNTYDDNDFTFLQTTQRPRGGTVAFLNADSKHRPQPHPPQRRRRSRTQ